QFLRFRREADRTMTACIVGLNEEVDQQQPRTHGHRLEPSCNIEQVENFGGQKITVVERTMQGIHDLAVRELLAVSQRDAKCLAYLRAFYFMPIDCHDEPHQRSGRMARNRFSEIGPWPRATKARPSATPRQALACRGRRRSAPNHSAD